MGWEDRDYYRSPDAPRQIRLGPYVVTPLAIVIIALCLSIYILQGVMPIRASDKVTKIFALTFSAGFRPWQIVTYQYLHGSAGHVFMNCLGIFFFLPSLENRWGWKKALIFYTLGGIAAALAFGVMGMAFQLGRNYLIGASGSVLACIGACALLFPGMQLILLVFPVPIRVAACLFGIFYLLSALGDRNLSDACHLGGLAFGFFAPMTIPWLHSLKARRAVKKEQDWIHEDQRQQEIVDRILEKVHREGMQSLSSSEKKALKKATEWQRSREKR